jgi:asparagine synthase (glutamine-hydrolysing)
MCGIVIAFSPGQPTSAATAQAMAGALRHRGPDGEGYLLHTPGSPPLRLAGPDTPEAVRHTPTPWQPQGDVRDLPLAAAPLILAQRRLAIVDLSPWGHQPMHRDGRWHAVYNGEIYNHLELRAELQAQGEAFLGHSDTEVLIALLAREGPQALNRCNGMWALALLDSDRQTLLLARDRFGVKPLYVWQGADGALLAASEIKALLLHPRVQAQVEPHAMRRFLEAGPQAWEAETGFAGITRFPAGHWAQIDLRQPGPLRPQPYWQPPPLADETVPFEPARAEALADEYRALLGDAVRLRLRADVRVGTALSGGLDSSSIAVLVNEALREAGHLAQQETFSSVYPSPSTRSSDESAFIAEVAARLGVRSNSIQPRAAAVLAEHERMIWALDTPPANTLMSSWHTYASVAQRGVVVTLDGQGADEQLAGYSRYVRNRLAHAPLRAVVSEAHALLGLQGFGSAVGIGLAAQALRRLGGRDFLRAVVQRLRMGGDPSLPLAAALAHDFQTHLQTLLLYGDKTSMAWSVESRMPFMDYRMVRFLAAVPPAYKIHAGWTKWLARHAMRDALPESVTWRRDKMGWAIPEPVWFGGELAVPLVQTLQGSAFVRQWAGELGIDLQRAPLPLRLRLLNLAVWHRLFFEETGRPGRALGRQGAKP